MPWLPTTRPSPENRSPHESAENPGRFTLTQWHDAFLAYWTTNRSSNGGTEAINGLIELTRRIAGGLDPTTPT
ncbi:MAG: transposase [Microbacterium sp.]